MMNVIGLIGLGLVWVFVGLLAIASDHNGQQTRADLFGSLWLALLILLAWVIFA